MPKGTNLLSAYPVRAFPMELLRKPHVSALRCMPVSILTLRESLELLQTAQIPVVENRFHHMKISEERTFTSKGEYNERYKVNC